MTDLTFNQRFGVRRLKMCVGQLKFRQLLLYL